MRSTLDGAGNVADLVRANATERPDHPALVTPAAPGRTRSALSWRDLDQLVDAVATGLPAGLGLHRGDRVALALGNSQAFVTAYFGLLRAGLVVVPLNTGYTSPEVARLLGAADVRAVLYEQATAPAVEEAVAGTRRALVDPAGLDALMAPVRTGGAPPEPVVAAGGGEDLAVLLFTSGTSGRPKGAMLSHRALLANLAQCSRLDPAPVRAEDVVLVVLPLFHVYGLNAALGMVAAAGATAVLLERFEPADSLRVVREEGVTSVPAAPPVYLAWADQPDLDVALAGVRMLASGAAPLPPSVVEQIHTRTGLNVHEGYGLTETAPVVTSTLASDQATTGSVGRPLPGVEVSLRDELGEPVPDADPGEIWVRGDNLFSGYWPDGADGPDPTDGWFATGDVAYADPHGDLHLVDRRKELVLVSGFNVYPREVEEALQEHPDIAEAAVIAVPHPQTGEAVKAFVVPVAGATVRPDDVVRHAAARLARFKTPTIVAVVSELPHSATGKVAKARLRARESPVLGEPS